jgi:predicted dehydrogenase
MPKISLGILGAGAIATAFIKRVKRHSAFDLVAIHSRSMVAMAKAVELAPQLQVHREMKSFLDDTSVSAVLICTPHALHTPHAIQCLRAVKHVLIEKPIATSIVELEALLKEVSKSSRVVVGLPHGEYPYLTKARELAEQGAIGAITSIHSYLDVPGPPRSNWYYSKSAIGGASLDTFPYALGRVLSFCKANVTGAVSYHNKLLPRRRCGDGGTVDSEVDDCFTMILRLSEGQQALVRSNWNISAAEDMLIVEGRDGRISVDCWRNVLRLTRAVGWNPNPAYSANLPIEDVFRLDPFDHEDLKLDLFAHHIRSGTSNLSEVGYAMLLNLKGMERVGGLTCPPGVYSSSEMLSSLMLGGEYL